ncbi:protein TRACHEARY ELEMENT DIFFERENTIATION-RELATED 7A-like [Salvia hispanica]|uniref:protein TRACHEARY ELEMENT DIFFERENTIATION-RELATED 7A-like n=1 Tax=Salvia hispanica TaxID=49212 RepID=UPI00200958B9|nr:protein TRACHEARY ELEMENT DIFFERENTIATION-RELATED 7A-like [Salvia hispanica]
MAAYEYFPSPPFPFVHPVAPPPPPHVVPPPPHVVPPPPPPHVVPPPPHVVPPPPHVHPPPFHPVAPPPHVPPPSPDNGPTVVIVVFASFGCFFFAAFCCFALWCFIKKRREKKTVNETDIVRTDEHIRVKEAIVQGPNGPELVVLSIEDDKHIQEEIIKNEKMEMKQLHTNAKSGETEAGNSSTISSTHQTRNLL